MRIVIFVGSPIVDDDKEVNCNFIAYLFKYILLFFKIYIFNLSFIFQIIKLAKRFKKEKVCVDVVNFGEDVSTFYGDVSIGQNKEYFFILVFFSLFSSYISVNF